MMFFYKKKKHKKHKNKDSFTRNCIKEKKRFGLSNEEMTELVGHMIDKPRIPIEFIN